MFNLCDAKLCVGGWVSEYVWEAGLIQLLA